jgi:hypothetical protein
MASLTINGVLQAEYKYDFAGRQAVRRLPQLGVTLHSVFDSDGRRIAEYDAATGALVWEYVWLGWSPVAVIEGGAVSFVRSDHIGRPVFATNAAGTKVWTASHLPFGGVRTTTGTPITGHWRRAAWFALPRARFTRRSRHETLAGEPLLAHRTTSATRSGNAASTPQTYDKRHT